MDKKEIIARRAAQELQDGHVVNLGIGLPTLVVGYLPEEVHVVFQSENGILGMRGLEPDEKADPDVINAGAQPVQVSLGGSFFDSCTSFNIIRGGHVDVAILGALQIDQEGDLASHVIPGKMMTGMGGAMDLVVGAQKVIIVTTHTAKGDAPKLLSKITLPATAIHAVDRIITEMAVIDIVDGKMVLKEYNPEYTVEEIQRLTEASLLIAEDLKEMTL